jgi:hypothetical protein
LYKSVGFLVLSNLTISSAIMQQTSTNPDCCEYYGLSMKYVIILTHMSYILKNCFLTCLAKSPFLLDCSCHAHFIKHDNVGLRRIMGDLLR